LGSLFDLLLQSAGENLDILLGKVLLEFEHVPDCSPGSLPHEYPIGCAVRRTSDLGPRQPRHQKFAREGLDVDGHTLSNTILINI